MLSSKGNTRTIYLHYAKDFLDFADGKLDRETVSKYIEHLRRKNKYSDGTINFAFRVVRTLFNRNKLDWSFTHGEAPQIREDNVNAPALDPDVIIEMIEAVKADGEPDERAFLAISTTYGTRKVEMVGLRPEDVNLKDRTIHITTAKHGRERTHLIPEEIAEQLGSYNFKTKATDFHLFALWHRLEYRIGLNHTDQVNWHSVRRILNTLLLDSLPETVVMSFLRWKQRTSSHMPFRYSAQRVVGREGVSTKVVGAAKDVDSKVFEVHPFLSFWV